MSSFLWIKNVPPTLEKRLNYKMPWGKHKGKSIRQILLSKHWGYFLGFKADNEYLNKHKGSEMTKAISVGVWFADAIRAEQADCWAHNFPCID